MEIKYEQNSSKMLVRTSLWQKKELPFHWHEKIEIIVCLEKGFSLLIDGINYDINEGDIAVVGEQRIHKFTVKENDTKLTIIQLPYEILLRSGEKLKPIKPIIRKEEVEEKTEFSENFYRLIEIIYSERENVNDDDIFLRNMYSGIYFLLMKHFGIDEISKTVKKEKNDFYKIVSYANEHFKDDINVQSIAGALFMDRGRMSKLFLKYSGVTLNFYINSLRLAMAEKLIEDGMKITHAALESGFQSVKTYNNVKRNIKQKEEQ